MQTRDGTRPKDRCCEHARPLLGGTLLWEEAWFTYVRPMPEAGDEGDEDG